MIKMKVVLIIKYSFTRILGLHNSNFKVILIYKFVDFVGS